MIARYVRADLTRNPRRTLSTMAGVMLGVGLSSGVLFFVDGLSASMTQRAVAPLPIDMQRVLSAPIAADLLLEQRVVPAGPVRAGDFVQVHLTVRNSDVVPANEVVVRSEPPTGMAFVEGSATLDGAAIDADAGNPLFVGVSRAGLNLGTMEAGATRTIEYEAMAAADADTNNVLFNSTVSSREALTPVGANAADPVDLGRLAADIAGLDGVAFAEQLSFADLPTGSLSSGGQADGRPARVFGFDTGYSEHDSTIEIVDGVQMPGHGLLSVEAARAAGVGIGDTVSLDLPDGARLAVTISGLVDLSGARSLFASRLGAHFEVFLYVPVSVVIDSAMFADMVMPSFERAAAARGERVKSPPVREIDIGVQRDLLDADPGTALEQTQQIGASVSAVAGRQDYLLDNISNTLAVARDDANVAKRLFLFLGIPGGLLAALLAAYAGNVLAGAQRREQATLRIRGASRRHLLALLALRVGCITIVGSIVGVALGYVSAALVIGQDTLTRAATGRLLTSGVLGTTLGLLATGAALYVTGRRSIDREINDDRARLAVRIPTWRRYRLDILGLLVIGVCTAAAIKASAFDGAPGSVYVGRSVELPLILLGLPIAAWIAGSLLAGRCFAWILQARHAKAAADFARPLRLLYRLSLRRRSWAVAEAAVVVGLIVALGTSLAVFTASYDRAKAADARFVTGSDIRVSPSPGLDEAYTSARRSEFEVDGVSTVVPVVYSTQNVIIQSHRTSDPMNLAATDPAAYQEVAPLNDDQFTTSTASLAIDSLVSQPNAVLLNVDKAEFLQAQVGDTLLVLLARGTAEQVETSLEVVGLFDRLPGFPDGVDALMNLAQHEAALPSTKPDFFLAQTTDGSDATLDRAVRGLLNGPAAGGGLQVESRATALAKDQSSLAALNIRGLLKLDSAYALAMGTVAIAIFVFGLLLQRRREYVTLRAQGVQPRAIRALITAEAGTVAVAGCISGVAVGLVMGIYFINVLRPLFVLTPPYHAPVGATLAVVASVLVATAFTSVAASPLVNRLRATELLRDE